MLAQFMLRTGTNLDCADLREQLLRVDSLISHTEREKYKSGFACPEMKLNLVLQLVAETKTPTISGGACEPKAVIQAASRLQNRP